MVKTTAVIKNSAGIHVRPSGIIFEAIKDFSGSVVIISHGKRYQLSSIMVLLSLGLVKGSEIQIEVNGPDEETKCKTLKELFEKEFDFPKR